MSEGTQRRLAAIVSADVAGYSRLMGRSERSTLAALKAHRGELIDPAVASHGGRIVKTTGDGLLLEFPSVVAAVDCCVAVQDGMALRNSDVAEDDAIRFRVGIHLGDVIAEDDDIFGDGVNIAARLQTVAEPGGIAISAVVFDYLDDETARGFVDLGERELKNIRRPIAIWLWSPTSKLAVMMADSVGGTELSTQNKPSIAVLPFDNMSEDPEQEYFADGITEDIITQLCRFRSLFVISRHSSFTYKGRSVRAQDIGTDLGVRYVTEGSVRKAGTRVRVTAQLVDAATGNHIWAERYDRELDDIFVLQNELTETIVAAIEPEISSAERERVLRKPARNLDAWDFYQRGLWHHLAFSTREDNEKAGKLFLKALELDPGFSLAYSGLAEQLRRKFMMAWTTELEATRKEVLRVARRAVAADGHDPQARYALGRAYGLRGDYQAAIAELEEALDLNPNLALAWFALGLTLTWSGRANDALAPLQRAIQQSPRDPHRMNFELMTGVAYFMLAEYEEAIVWFSRSCRHTSTTFWSHIGLATTYAAFDRMEESRTSLQDALNIKPNLSITLVEELLRGQRSEYNEPYLSGLRKAGLPE